MTQRHSAPGTGKPTGAALAVVALISAASANSPTGRAESTDQPQEAQPHDGR